MAIVLLPIAILGSGRSFAHASHDIDLLSLK